MYCHIGPPRRGAGAELLPAGRRDGARLPRQGRHPQGHQGEIGFNVGSASFYTTIFFSYLLFDLISIIVQ